MMGDLHGGRTFGIQDGCSFDRLLFQETTMGKWWWDFSNARSEKLGILLCPVLIRFIRLALTF